VPHDRAAPEPGPSGPAASRQERSHPTGPSVTKPPSLVWRDASYYKPAVSAPADAVRAQAKLGLSKSEDRRG